MLVLVIEPNKTPYMKKIKDSYKDTKEIVGGYIEAIRLREDIVMWLNEEGKLIPLEPNIAMVHDEELVDIVMGNVVIAGVNEEGDTIGLTDEMLSYISKILGGVETNRGPLHAIFLEPLL